MTLWMMTTLFAQMSTRQSEQGVTQKTGRFPPQLPWVCRGQETHPSAHSGQGD